MWGSQACLGSAGPWVLSPVSHSQRAFTEKIARVTSLERTLNLAIFFSKLKISFRIHCVLSFLKEGDEARKEGETILEF